MNAGQSGLIDTPGSVVTQPHPGQVEQIHGFLLVRCASSPGHFVDVCGRQIVHFFAKVGDDFGVPAVWHLAERSDACNNGMPAITSPHPDIFAVAVGLGANFGTARALLTIDLAIRQIER